MRRASNTTMPRLARIVALVGLGLGLSSCAATSVDAVIETEPQPRPAEYAPLGSSGYGPTAAETDGASPWPPSAATASVLHTDEGDIRRADGRPAWWIEQPEYERGHVRVCAEALGASVSEARDRALAKARSELRRVLLLPPESAAVEGERVEKTWVSPLPARGGPNAYAGYVMIAGPVP